MRIRASRSEADRAREGKGEMRQSHTVQSRRVNLDRADYRDTRYLRQVQCSFNRLGSVCPHRCNIPCELIRIFLKSLLSKPSDYPRGNHIRFHPLPRCLPPQSSQRPCPNGSAHAENAELMGRSLPNRRGIGTTRVETGPRTRRSQTKRWKR